MGWGRWFRMVVGSLLSIVVHGSLGRDTDKGEDAEE